MAVIRIKEGSLTIEVFNDDDDPKLVASMHFPQENITFDGADIEVLMKKSGHPGQHEAAHLHGNGQGKRKISKKK